MTIRLQALLALVVALPLSAVSSVVLTQETAPTGTTSVDPTPNATAATTVPEPNVADDLVQIRQQITDAERELAGYQGGLVKGLIQARLEILRLSETMLVQKDLAAKSGAVFAFALPAAPTDAKRAQDLLGDITTAEQELPSGAWRREHLIPADASEIARGRSSDVVLHFIGAAGT